MQRKYKLLAGVAGLTLVGGAVGALAQETTTYSYDELGRLAESVIAGGTNDGQRTGTCFDRAGNRTRYNVATSAPGTCPIPAPTPTPLPTPTPAPTPTPTPPPVTPPEFSILEAQGVSEGAPLIYTVHKVGSDNLTYTVSFQSANGTATAGSDYTATGGTLTFAPSDVNKTISVATADDVGAESPETVLVSLTGVSGGASIGTSQGTGTIFDNDTPNQAPVVVNDSGNVRRCDADQFAVLANDYDPDGNTPLALVSVSYNGPLGSASIIGDDIYFMAQASSGTANISYTMRDSLGATSSGVLNISVAGLCEPD